MKRTIQFGAIAALALALAVGTALAQPFPGAARQVTMTSKGGDPSGACTSGRMFSNTLTNHLFVCISQGWVDVASMGPGAPFPLLAPTGCVAPPYAFAGFTTTGVCHDGASVLALRVAGADHLTIGPTFAELAFTSGTESHLFSQATDLTLIRTIDTDFTAQVRLEQDNNEIVLRSLSTSGAYGEITLTGAGTYDLTTSDGATGGTSVAHSSTGGTISFEAFTAAGGAGRLKIAPQATALKNGTLVASGATIAVTGNVFHVSGTNTITTITIPASLTSGGLCITMIFNAILTVTDGSNLKLAGDFVTTADDSLSLCEDGSNWYETARSIN